VIVLSGPKHCGKTTAGGLLAAALNRPFFDLDAQIQKETGKTPRDIFAEGPEVFRKAEEEALRRLLSLPEAENATLAAGGGVIDNPAAMSLLNSAQAIIVYIEISAATAWNRIVPGGLPAFLKTDDPKETHRLLHERRAAEYKKAARFTVNAENKSPHETVCLIMNILKKMDFNV
jgi:shikimate kinase